MYKSYKEQRDAGKFKLIYFNGKGRAESIRLLFAASGTHYEDKRIAKEEWPDLKPTMPYGQLPVLEVHGNMVGQSGAIARYVAREVGMDGDSSLDQACVDAICDIITDIREKAAKVRFMKEEEEKNTAMAELQEYYTRMFGCLAKFLEDNNGGDGYFVGDKMTRADVHFYATVELLQTMTPDLITSHQKLTDLMERIQTQENIAKYLEARPETEF